jgi:quercetin dioxygenase-like cupin family protein
MATHSISLLGPDWPQCRTAQHHAWHSWRRAMLRVRSGRVWVTAGGRLEDHFLDAGDGLELPAHVHVLIGAETAARVEIEQSR